MVFLASGACGASASSYVFLVLGRAAARERPARVHVLFVVFIFPVGAAALADITGDGDGAGFTLALVVVALGQLDVAGGFAPVALDTGAGIAHFDFFEFRGAVVIVGHGVLVRSRRRARKARMGHDCT